MYFFLPKFFMLIPPNKTNNNSGACLSRARVDQGTDWRELWRPSLLGALVRLPVNCASRRSGSTGCARPGSGEQIASYHSFGAISQPRQVDVKFRRCFVQRCRCLPESPTLADVGRDGARVCLTPPSLVDLDRYSLQHRARIVSSRASLAQRRSLRPPTCSAEHCPPSSPRDQVRSTRLARLGSRVGLQSSPPVSKLADGLGAVSGPSRVADRPRGRLTGRSTGLTPRLPDRPSDHRAAGPSAG